MIKWSSLKYYSHHAQIIEDCEERFTDEQGEDILRIVSSTLPAMPEVQTVEDTGAALYAGMSECSISCVFESSVQHEMNADLY